MSGHEIGGRYPHGEPVQNPAVYPPDIDVYENMFTANQPDDSHIRDLVSEAGAGTREPIFLTRCWFMAASMFRANAMRDLQPNPLFLIAEDLDFFLRFMERHATAVVPEYLYRYRVYGMHQSSLSSSPLITHYVLAAFLCALYRRQGKPEPFQESTGVRDLVPLFKELPIPIVAYCLKGLRHKMKKMLVLKQDEWLFTLLTDMDKAFLGSEHATYYAHIRRQACRRLRKTALKRGKFLWLLKNSRRLASP